MSADFSSSSSSAGGPNRASCAGTRLQVVLASRDVICTSHAPRRFQTRNLEVESGHERLHGSYILFYAFNAQGGPFAYEPGLDRLGF